MLRQGVKGEGDSGRVETGKSWGWIKERNFLGKRGLGFLKIKGSVGLGTCKVRTTRNYELGVPPETDVGLG